MRTRTQTASTRILTLVMPVMIVENTLVTNRTMTDYKERLSGIIQSYVRRDDLDQAYLVGEPAKLKKDLLAFIEEEKKSDTIYGYEQGKNAERQRITSLIDGMRKTSTERCICISGEPFCDRCETERYNQALDDLLSKIRGEEKVVGEYQGFELRGGNCEDECLQHKGSIFFKDAHMCKCHPRTQSGIQEAERIVEHMKDMEIEARCIVTAMKNRSTPQEETVCCKKCRITSHSPQTGTKFCCLFDGFRTDGFNCPCHKPRTEETEKEGASFSGREVTCDGCGWCLASDAPTGEICAKTRECDCHGPPRPKEPTTPQSRERGGENN